ncbi:Cof-type HAD-IIB family hydrolase [Bacillus sp. DJP31]|uniref:Cof-type HAD-IIB family hydrolase n=1 Tax=Bacillus sp. DJP31 TaxID=3409789 RepID=UPI003BB5C242
MQNTKLIFFDLDGTLLNHNKQIPTNTIKAIESLRSAGHFVAIATGRAPFMFKEIRENLSIDTFISFNGQFVVHENEPIFKNPLKKSTLQRLHVESNESGHPLVFMDHLTMKASSGDHPHIHESLGTLHFTHPEVDPLYYVDNDIYQTLLFCKSVDEMPYVGSYSDFHFIRWHKYSTDVLPHGGSKAKGIEVMMKKLGFQREDVIAFGDGLNDLEMLEFAGTGVAMGNGVQKAKEIANIVTKSVDEDGIVYGLEMLKLI